ncbi:hypothetical protein ACWKWU_03175 [Chitinophaga lutea]
MKNLISLFILICLHTSVYAQERLTGPQVVLGFVSYITDSSWNIDTITTKYVHFMKEESKVASRETRKKHLGQAITMVSNELKKYPPGELEVIPYAYAPDSLQTLFLDDDYVYRSFILRSKTDGYKRYFLVKDDKVEAFLLFNDRAYLILN